jgi:hypothetical protein
MFADRCFTTPVTRLMSVIAMFQQFTPKESAHERPDFQCGYISGQSCVR